MKKTEHLLQILSEECNEVAHQVSKALRFGLTEIQEGQELTNAERIVYEFNDILAVMEILCDEGLISKVVDDEAILLKKKKILKYLEYSEGLGMVKVENHWIPDLSFVPNNKEIEVLFQSGAIVDYSSNNWPQQDMATHWRIKSDK